MKRIISFLLIMFVLLSLNIYADASANSGTATALFLTIPPDARSSAMGEAGTARGDDVSTLFWNPAGLVNVRNLEFIFTHADYLADFNYNFLAGAFSLKNIGSIGLGLNFIGTDPFKQYDNQGEEVAEYNNFQDLAFNCAYARRINDFISAGATFKYISQTLVSESFTSFAVDAGVLLDDMFVKNLFTGASVKNLGGGPKIGSGSDSLPFNISVGAMYNLNLGSFSSKSLVDVNLPNYYDMNFGIGEEIEMTFGESFAVYPRVGFKIPFEHGFLNGLTMGLGIKFLNYNVDYSFLNYGDLKSIHKISVLYKSLGIAPSEEPEVKEEVEVPVEEEKVEEPEIEEIEVPVEEEKVEEEIEIPVEEEKVEEPEVEEEVEVPVEEEKVEEAPPEEDTSIEDDMDKLLEEE